MDIESENTESKTEMTFCQKLTLAVVSSVIIGIMAIIGQFATAKVAANKDLQDKNHELAFVNADLKLEKESNMREMLMLEQAVYDSFGFDDSKHLSPVDGVRFPPGTEVVLDGKVFTNCVFDEVVLVYNATARTKVSDSIFEGSNRIRSDNLQVAMTIDLVFKLINTPKIKLKPAPRPI